MKHGGTTTMSYSPWDTLTQMPDVTLRIDELGDDYLGWWDRETRTLALHRRQSQRQMRCTLAHELEHVCRDDEDVFDVSPVLAARQEIAACMRAARRLIPIEALVDALLWSHYESELAEELNVDEDTLRIRLLTLTPTEHAIIDERLAETRGIA